MPKHKSITNDTLANKMLAKHPKFNAMYYKKYTYTFANDGSSKGLKLVTEPKDTELVSVRVSRQVNKEKVHGHNIERNEDKISIWDKRGQTVNTSKLLETRDHYTGNTNYPFLQLSVRQNRKDFGILVDDIDFAINVLNQGKNNIQEEIDNLKQS